MRKSIVIAAAALAAIAVGFPFSAAHADTPCGGAIEQTQQAYRIGLQHFDQEIATQEAKLQEHLQTLRDMHNPIVDRFVRDWDNATNYGAQFGAVTELRERVQNPTTFGAAAFMTDQAIDDMRNAIDLGREMLMIEETLQKLRKARAPIKDVVDGFDSNASGASSQGACVPGDPNSDDPRTALEQRQDQFEQQRVARVAQVAAFAPTFLTRRRTFLAELPADMRGNLENGGSDDWAGRASVTYTAMKIQIEMQAAANEGRNVPEALTALNSLYNQMSGYHSAVLETEVQIAQVQKNIAHTIVDEKGYAPGGGDGGGGEGGNGGGN